MNGTLSGKIIYVFGELISGIISTLILLSVISTIWLLVVGGWRLVVLGLIVGVIFPYVDTLLMLPAMGLMALILKWKKKIFAVSFPLTLLAIIYQQAIMVLWSFFVISYIVPISDHYILSTLFGLSVVMSPLTYMARNEDGLGTIIGLLVAFISYVLMAIFSLTGMPIFLLLVFLMLIITISIQGVAMYGALKAESHKSALTE